MMLSLYVISFFLLVFSTSVASLNVCGGFRPIVNEDRLGKLCETNLKSDCPFGHFACASTDVLSCFPNCLLTLNDLSSELCQPLEAPFVIKEEEKEERFLCENNGTLTCTCPRNYNGLHCETYDPCINVNCGNNGKCVNGDCVCNNLFSGKQCEIHSGCTAKGFQWTGKTCKCAEGYTGPHCNQCDPALICLPNNKTGDYVRVYIDDQAIIEEILAAEKLPGYTLIPYQPNIRSALGCACTNFIDVLRGKDALVSNYMDSDNLFVHHFYKTTYKSSSSSSSSSFLSVFLWIFIAIFSVFVLVVGLFACMSLKSRLSWSNSGLVYEPRSASPLRSQQKPKRVQKSLLTMQSGN